jgi:hypothetical protein
MNGIRHIRRIAGVLAGLACAVLGLAPAAFATPHPIPPPGGAAGYNTPAPLAPGPQQPYPGANLPPARVPTQIHAVTHTVVIGGMPGWQIALIAIGAALLAATVAVLADRARTGRLKSAAAAA